jgi:hypothetical protein
MLSSGAVVKDVAVVTVQAKFSKFVAQRGGRCASGLRLLLQA